MLTNPLTEYLRITDDMRDQTVSLIRESAEIGLRVREACGATDDFWDSIEDDPLAPDAQITEETA